MNRSDIKKKVNVKQQFGSNMTRTSSHGISFSSRVGHKGMGGSHSKMMAASGSKWNVNEKMNRKPPVQVIDDMGNDVTPRSLLTLDANAVKRVNSNNGIFGSESLATPSDLGQSIYAASNASFLGGFSGRSVMGSVTVSGWSSPESISEDLAEPGTRRYDMATGLGDIQRKYVPVKEDLTELDLDKVINLTLEETDTIWLLDIPGTSVSEESDIAQSVKDANSRYSEALKTRPGNDSFVERGMQTFNNEPKNKELQTVPITQNEVGCMATTWDMHDVFAVSSSEIKDERSGADHISLSRPTSAERNGTADVDSGSSASPAIRTGSVLSGSLYSGSQVSIATKLSEDDLSSKDGKKNDENGGEGTLTNDPNHPLLQTDELRKDLFTMERVISLNTFQARQARYRGFNVVPDVDVKVEKDPEKLPSPVVSVTELGPNLDKLWTYSCSITKGRNVSCMAWNPQNPDILAVGYGEFEFSNQKGGVACCWSLKNPEYPERVFDVESGVMTLGFSQLQPNLLAFGLYDGTIVIYNVRSQADSPVLDSLESEGKHIAPVWHVKWVVRDQSNGDDKDEILVSVAADGRVTNWSIRKGFECADLMKLKRINIQKQRGRKSASHNKKSDALISRFAAGFSFDFHPNDSNIYIIGTEEGHIHKCSCSYNEQYLESYVGHTGPIYELRWSPFLADVFLSCSADWSVKLWHQDSPSPIYTFSSSTNSVNSICWSPISSTIFGCVHEGGIEVWDLRQSTLDPLIVNAPLQEVKLSSVSFALNSNSVLVGDSDGQINVFLLAGLRSASEENNLAAIIQPNVAKQIRPRR
ncbi:WD repeat-containing protein 78-like isoform X2 [Dendronephthya gigantea]|uniref:WD repeat-containing protein 78-like isoform X2 n=1 Tax=Dendronephthya gigantea TaxID=151771 RepID=UPI00106C49C1|nr:WD repeat-containing protein 78-like isoform X2 [Dendronephthya gigantea]